MPVQDGTRTDDLGAFAPRRTRVVALSLAAGITVMMLLIAVFVSGRYELWDRAGFVVVALIIDVVLWRQATVRAVPSEAGLHVRNLFLQQHVEWSQVVSVRFGERPWPQLDLDDGETLAVMGIQRSDGPRAVAEAQRLARLVDRFSAVAQDD